MPWYKVTLSDADISAGKHFSLQDEFAALFVAALAPKGAGAFSALEITENTFYFSPGAAKIAMHLIARYGGVECAAPAASDVAVFVADSLDEIPFSSAH